MYIDASEYDRVIFQDGTTATDLLGIEEHTASIREYLGGPTVVEIKLLITWLDQDGAIQTRLTDHRDVRLIKR